MMDKVSNFTQQKQGQTFFCGGNNVRKNLSILLILLSVEYKS